MAYIPPFLSNSVRLRPLQFPSSPPAEQAAGSDYCPAWVLVNSLLLSFARAGVARQIVAHIAIHIRPTTLPARL